MVGEPPGLHDVVDLLAPVADDVAGGVGAGGGPAAVHVGRGGGRGAGAGGADKAQSGNKFFVSRDIFF